MLGIGQKRGKRYEIDMTEGPLLPKILRFSVPLILTGILQLLYNAADVIVVGNFADGHEPLAAVSSTGSLINLLVNLFMGLSVGASVVIARSILRTITFWSTACSNSAASLATAKMSRYRSMT